MFGSGHGILLCTTVVVRDGSAVDLDVGFGVWVGTVGRYLVHRRIADRIDVVGWPPTKEVGVVDQDKVW